MARIAARSHLAHDLFRKTGFHFSGSCFCCRSSVVEHSLGKGEVVSSILTGSTSFQRLMCSIAQYRAERYGNARTKSVGNRWDLFTMRCRIFGLSSVFRLLIYVHSALSLSDTELILM